MSWQMIVGAIALFILLLLWLFGRSPAPSRYVPPPVRRRGSGCSTMIALVSLLVLLVYTSPRWLPYMPLGNTPVHTTTQSVTPTPTKGTRAYYIDLARKDATLVGIDPALFVRQINEESGWNPKAISSEGAIGIAQFMKGTADALGVNPYNPEQSLLGAAKLMASYVKLFHGSYAMALAAYNAGSGTVIGAIAAAQKHGGSWDSYLPSETQRYIHLILGQA